MIARHHLLALLCCRLAASSEGALATIPVLFDSSNSLHRDLQYHPEQPARITETIKALHKHGQSGNARWELVDFAEQSEDLLAGDKSSDGDSVVRRPFSESELDHALNILLNTHRESLVTQLETSCTRAKERRIQEGRDPLGSMGYLDPDTFLTTETFAVCLRATAAWIRAVNLALETKTPAMALTRPPGHHATRHLSNGFCIYNFAAAAAIHVLQRDPDARVSILDWDVHYGQGVADIVQHFPNARYVSMHQTPAFPYMGESLKISGAHDNVLTLPVRPESSWTCGYEQAFGQALEFVASAGESSWIPTVVIVCAGYDALDSDELASCALQAPDFGKMARLLRQHLREQTGGDNVPIMLGLEGGYQLSPMAGGGNLQQAVMETLLALESND